MSKNDTIFYDIVKDIYLSKKFLNENLLNDSSIETILKKYRAKNLLTNEVNEMLYKYDIIKKHNRENI